MAAISHLPEAVEKRVFICLKEREWLRISELSAGPLSKAARDDIYWHKHFEQEGNSKTLPLKLDGADGVVMSYFARAVSARHLAAFRRPPATTHDLCLPAPCSHFVVVARDNGTVPVLFSMSTSGRVVLHDPHGEELNAESLREITLHNPTATACGMNSNNVEADVSESAFMLSDFVLPELAEPIAELSDRSASGSKNDNSVVVDLPKRKGKKSPQAHIKQGPKNLCSPLKTPAVRLQRDVPTAAQSIRAGALFAMETGTNVSVVQADKWGDIHRAGFASKLSLSVDSDAAHTDGSAICDSHENAPQKLCIQSLVMFGEGRFIAAGTNTLGTLVWDLFGSQFTSASRCHGASPVSHRKEERGPCFRCGQTGHWAKSCPLNAESTTSLANSSSPPPATPLSPMTSSKGASSISILVAVATGIGPVRSVGGIWSGACSSSVAQPYVFSASASRIVCDALTLDNSKTCVVQRLFSVNTAGELDGIGLAASVFASQTPCAEHPNRLNFLTWIMCDAGVSMITYDASSGESSLVHSTDDRRTVGVAIKAIDTEMSASFYMHSLRGAYFGGADGRILLFRQKSDADSSSGIRCKTCCGASTKAAAVTCLAAESCLPVLLAGSADGTVKIWDSTSWQCLRTLRYFGEGPVTALTLIACAPYRGVAVSMKEEPKLHVAWFGRAPASGMYKGKITKTDQKSKRHIENPGKASTCTDWRGTVANTRKAASAYGSATYNHRGTHRKERRDLAARVKVTQTAGVGDIGFVGNHSAPLFRAGDEALQSTGPTPQAAEDAWRESYYADDVYDDYDYDDEYADYQDYD